MHLYVVSTIQNLFPHKDIIVHKIQAIKSIWFNISLDSNISICQKSWCWNFFPITEIKLCTIYIVRFANPHKTFLIISYALAIVFLPTKNMYACMYWNNKFKFQTFVFEIGHRVEPCFDLMHFIFFGTNCISIHYFLLHYYFFKVLMWEGLNFNYFISF